jgi:hypothetical protein
MPRNNSEFGAKDPALEQDGMRPGAIGAASMRQPRKPLPSTSGSGFIRGIPVTDDQHDGDLHDWP